MLNDLTRRETEVLALMARGLTNPAIAESMGIGVKGVEKNAHRLYKRLGLDGRPGGNARVLAVLLYLTERLSDREVLSLYREYSEEMWRASFAVSSERIVNEFLDWLSDRLRPRELESYETEMLAEYRRQEEG